MNTTFTNEKFSAPMGNLKASAIREILKFTSDPSVISFAAGNPAPEAFPVDAVKEITEHIMSQDPIGAMQYSITEGYIPLRENIKKVILSSDSILKDGDDLVIVSGAQQGIELTCKVLCNPGDTILCEAPSFVGSLNSFKSYGGNLVGIDLEEDGISLEKLEHALKTEKNIKFLYLIPNFQNPSGRTMSLEKRKAVLQLAQKYDFFILEDNPYGALRFAGEDVPAIKSLDETGRVIYCGSFSKILAPGFRVGYVVAQSAILQKIIVCKQCSDVHTNIFSQMICSDFLEKYDYSTHINRLRQIYRHKSQLMLQGIRDHFHPEISYTEPQGGLFIWCTLPEGVDMMEFCSKAVKNRVAVVPGTAFMVHESDPTQSFRLNYSTPTDEKIVEGIKLLGDMTKQI